MAGSPRSTDRAHGHAAHVSERTIPHDVAAIGLTAAEPGDVAYDADDAANYPLRNVPIADLLGFAFDAGNPDMTSAVLEASEDDAVLLNLALSNEDAPLDDRTRERVMLRHRRRQEVARELHRRQVDALHAAAKAEKKP